MPSLFVLDLTREVTHNDVKRKPGGASEYQLYRLLEHLAATNAFDKIHCYNHIHTPCTVDGISFFPHTHFAVAVNNEKNPPVVLVQRFWPNIHSNVIPALRRLPRVFLWLHDKECDAMFRYFNQGIELSVVQAEVNRWPGVMYIPVSNYMKNIFQQEPTLNCKPMHVIHNAFYEDEFQNLPAARIPLAERTHLVYASSWHKGVMEVVQMFRKLIRKNPSYVLELLSPGYDGCVDGWKREIKEMLGNRVIIHEPKKREELAVILANALVVLTPPFCETFGCLFAEATHIGTHVLVERRSGAVSEVVGDACEVVSYDDVDQCLRVIESIRSGQHSATPSLAPHFKQPFLLQRWLDVLLH